MKHSNYLRLAVLGLIIAAPSINAQPDSLWSVSFGSKDNDQASAVYELDDGAFLIGCDAGTERGDWDVSLVMFSPAGDSVWGEIYQAPNDDFVKTILPWFYGGYMLCGWSRTNTDGFPQFMMICVSRSGKELWRKTFGETESITYSVVMDDNADYYFLGTVIHAVKEGDPRNWDARIMKISANGDSLWTKDYGSADQYERMYKGIRTMDGGFAMTGYQKSSDPYAEGQDVLLMKFDRHANLEWSRTYGSAYEIEEAGCIVQTPDEGYVLSGQYNSSERDNMDGFALKVDAKGDSIWFKTIGTERHDYFRSSVITPEGDVILTGSSGYARRNYDFHAICLDNVSGELLWEKAFGGPAWDFCDNSTLLSDGSLIMVGESQTFTCDPNHLINDSWVIRIGYPNQIEPTAHDVVVPGDLRIESISPNPFNARTTVTLELPYRGDAVLNLTDIGGRTLRELTLPISAPGRQNVAITGEGLATGSYWLNVRQGGSSVATKLVMIR